MKRIPSWPRISDLSMMMTEWIENAMGVSLYCNPVSHSSSSAMEAALCHNVNNNVMVNKKQDTRRQDVSDEWLSWDLRI
eukprot:scaffold3710_cov286-Chaetoceros_neogracile.AAC.5